jgi:hypothetical protein
MLPKLALSWHNGEHKEARFGMKTAEAHQLGDQIATELCAGQAGAAYAQLSPRLHQRIHFNMLDKVGQRIYHRAGKESWSTTLEFIQHITVEASMGGWVLIACILRDRFEDAPAEAFDLCQDTIIAAGVWYTTDILGERLPGPALLVKFETARNLLDSWRFHTNRWVRRTVGVAVHFWAKRCQDEPFTAGKLLEFLAPMFEERQVDAIKGVGWGLKTIGRVYPDLLVDWLQDQLVTRHRQPARLMLRKALTYLPPQHRTRLLGEAYP